MVKLVNRAKMSTDTVGDGGTINLTSAVAGFQSFADAGVADTDVVSYVIEDGTAWETGTGTYTASGTTLSRTVSESSNADAAISLSGTAVVFVTALAEDIEPANADILKADVHDTLTAGFDITPEALGTVSSGTITIEVDGPGKANAKTLTANGAFAIVPPSTSSSCWGIIQLTNGASAGSIDTSAFTIVNGDPYETTNGNDYFLHWKKIGSFSSMTIEALQ